MKDEPTSAYISQAELTNLSMGSAHRSWAQESSASCVELLILVAGRIDYPFYNYNFQVSHLFVT